MRKALAAVASSVVIAVAFSAFSSARALPAPEPSNSELSVGLVQWGAETETLPVMGQDEIMAILLDLARPLTESASKTAMCETLAAAAQTHALPVGFFVRLIDQESGFDPHSVSKAGAQGVAQFMPAVAKEWGLSNPFDPHAALMASARFLRALYDQFGNWGLAAAAYNGGGSRVQKWLDKRGKLPDETRHYVQTITGVAPEQWIGTKTRGTFTLPPRAPCQEIAHLADRPDDAAPVPMHTQVVAGPPSKTATAVVAVTLRHGMKMAVIKVKGASKVAAVNDKIAAPKTIVADAATTTKGKRGKATAAVKVAEKAAEKPAAKPPIKAKDNKKTKGRIQVADARGARK
jgi:hypothetical protein